MKKIKGLLRPSINKYLILCLVIMSFSMFYAVFYFYHAFFSAQETHTREQYSLLCNRVENDFHEALFSASTIASSFGYDTTLQQYLLSNEDQVDPTLFFQAKGVTNLAAQLAAKDSYEAICFYSNTGRYLVSNEECADYFSQVISRSHLDTNVNVRYNFITTVVPRSALQSKLLVFVFPLQRILPISSGDSNVLHEDNGHMYCMILADPTLLLSSMFITDDNSAIVLTSNQHVLASSRYLNSTETSLVLHSGKVTSHSSSGEYLAERITLSAGYYLFYLIPRSALSNSLEVIRSEAVFFVLCTFILTLLVCSYFMLRVNQAVRTMLRELDGVVSDVRADAPSIEFRPLSPPNMTELDRIIDSANHMLERIQSIQHAKEASDRALLETTIEQQKAEMLAYRSQINPHFLFNALETMRSMAQYVDEVPLTEMISALSSMLRHVLYSRSYTVFQNELQSVSDYMAITQIRFPDRYTFRTRIEPGTENCRCLCMMLQPFVENSIRYAFAGYKKTAPPTILIRTYMDPHAENRLCVDIIDNGKGMSPEDTARLTAYYHNRPGSQEREDKYSIGLSNVYHRLKIAYGTHCHLILSASEGHYTKIEIRIPQNQDL